jgi:DNA-binding protein H-NS
MSQAQFQAEVMDELRQQEELEQQKIQENLTESIALFKEQHAKFNEIFGGNNDANK